MLNGAWKMNTVIKKLKASCTDRDLGLLDRSAKKSFNGVGFAGEEDEPEAASEHDSGEKAWAYLEGDGVRGSVLGADEEDRWNEEPYAAGRDGSYAVSDHYSNDSADVAALQDHTAEGQVMAVSANRIFLEARQPCTDMAKNRSGYWPVVGIAAGPPVGGASPGSPGKGSRKKGTDKGKKCGG